MFFLTFCFLFVYSINTKRFFSMATLSFKGLNKIYPNKVQAVFDFNLEIQDKEFIVFVGPSGCGKSTTLRMVAGLEDITSGELYINGALVNNVAPKDRNIAMVFQSYALYPHMTVYGNMAFALKLRKIPRPIYQPSDEVKELEVRRDELFKAAAAVNRKLKKKVEDELLQECLDIYHEIYNVTDEIESKSVQIIGRDETNIKRLNKQIEKLNKETSKNEALLQKYSAELDRELMNDDAQLIERELKKHQEKVDDLKFAVNILTNDIERNNNQVKILAEELINLESHDVPLCKERHLTKKEIDIEVHKAAESLDLIRYLYRKPAALSGGQRQRVALGRAIVRKPKVFLMDEPLSNLDAKLRVQTRSEIIKIHKRVGATTIYVTHDQTEAMTMADRIVIMRDGYIQQIGTPTQVYDDPANKFVGGFIGSPAMNFLKGRLSGNNFIIEGKNEIQIQLSEKHLDTLREYQGKEIYLGIRPEAVYLKGDKANEKPGDDITDVCDFAELLGYELIIYTYLNGQKFIIKTSIKSHVESGDQITFNFNMNNVYFFDAETEKRIK